MDSLGVHRPRNLDWKRAAALLYGDWGTSKAYVIGLAFVAAGYSSLPIILAVCVLTAVVGYSYVIICKHYPDGGGVYSAARDQSRLLAVVGALLLVANFTVTAAMSGWAAMNYFRVPDAYVPMAAALVVVAIGVMNFYGPKHTGSLAILLAAPMVGVVVFVILMALPHLSPREAATFATALWTEMGGVHGSDPGSQRCGGDRESHRGDGRRCGFEPGPPASRGHSHARDPDRRRRSGARHSVVGLGGVIVAGFSSAGAGTALGGYAAIPGRGIRSHDLWGGIRQTVRVAGGWRGGLAVVERGQHGGGRDDRSRLHDGAGWRNASFFCQTQFPRRSAVAVGDRGGAASGSGWVGRRSSCLGRLVCDWRGGRDRRQPRHLHLEQASAAGLVRTHADGPYLRHVGGRRANGGLDPSQRLVLRSLCAGNRLGLRGYAQRRAGLRTLTVSAEIAAAVSPESVPGFRLNLPPGLSILVAARGLNPVLGFALEEARLRQSTLYVLFVKEVAVNLLGPVESAERPRWQSDPVASEIMYRMLALGKENGVTVVPVYLVSDDPAASILDLAATLGIDILVLGTPHRHALVRLLKGNVVTEVAENLPENIQLIIYG